LHHVLHHHHARHHAHHRHAFTIIVSRRSWDWIWSLNCCSGLFSFNFGLQFDCIPRLFSFVNYLAILDEGIDEPLVLFFPYHVPIDVHLQNVLELYEGLSILATDPFVYNPSFVVAGVVLVNFLLDGNPIRDGNPAAHLYAFGHQAPLAFSDDPCGPSAAAHWPRHCASDARQGLAAGRLARASFTGQGKGFAVVRPI